MQIGGLGEKGSALVQPGQHFPMAGSVRSSASILTTTPANEPSACSSLRLSAMLGAPLRNRERKVALI